MSHVNARAKYNETLARATRAMDQFGADLLWRNAEAGDSELAVRGFKVYRIPDDIARNLEGFFAQSCRRPFTIDDCLDSYLDAGLEQSVADALNVKNAFYGEASALAQSALIKWLQTNADEIGRQLGHDFAIANVRAWETYPDDDFGPTAWHADAYSSFANKIMVYPAPMNAHNGTLEIYDRQGNLHALETEWPAAVLFDNAQLLHRGRPGKVTRRAIEVQTMPAERTSIEYVYAGQNARGPLNFSPLIQAQLMKERYRPSFNWRALIPEPVKAVIRRVLRGRTAPAPKPEVITNHGAYLNIGGGAGFQHTGWVNLESAVGPKNLFPFHLTPGCIFPVRSGIMQKVYSSHCLEHLDDATVAQVLREARRVIARDGRLVIKIPDFDEVLERWRAADKGYFDRWYIDSVVHSWPNKNMPDTLSMRASFIFCGYWNAAWGDHFSSERRQRPGAYHGPATTAAKIDAILEGHPPHTIAQVLSDYVRSRESDYTFNHQNAWSRAEFADLLHKHGFCLQSTDRASILAEHFDIPDITSNEAISAYYEATPI